MSALYDRAVALWGVEPTRWPHWSCMTCGQRNSRWALECGRCLAQRDVPS